MKIILLLLSCCMTSVFAAELNDIASQNRAAIRANLEADIERMERSGDPGGARVARQKLIDLQAEEDRKAEADFEDSRQQAQSKALWTFGGFFLVMLFLYVGTTIVISLLVAHVAQRKGHEYWLWFFLGFLFHFVALLVVACLADKQQREPRVSRIREGQQEQRFPCPECGEMIQIVAKSCRFCQAIISDKDRIEALKNPLSRTLTLKPVQTLGSPPIRPALSAGPSRRQRSPARSAMPTGLIFWGLCGSGIVAIAIVGWIIVSNDQAKAAKAAAEKEELARQSAQANRLNAEQAKRRELEEAEKRKHQVELETLRAEQEAARMKTAAAQAEAKKLELERQAIEDKKREIDDRNRTIALEKQQEAERLAAIKAEKEATEKKVRDTAAAVERRKINEQQEAKRQQDEFNAKLKPLIARKSDLEKNVRIWTVRLQTAENYKKQGEVDLANAQQQGNGTISGGGGSRIVFDNTQAIGTAQATINKGIADMNEAQNKLNQFKGDLEGVTRDIDNIQK